MSEIQKLLKEVLIYMTSADAQKAKDEILSTLSAMRSSTSEGQKEAIQRLIEESEKPLSEKLSSFR